MNNYVKPMIFDNDELAEGIYATNSGAGDNCWMVTSSVAQRNTDPYDPFVNFRINGVHIAEHTCKELTIVLTFNALVKSAVFDFAGFECEPDGMVVRLKRINHSNGFGTMDNFDTNLRVVTDYPGLIDVIGISWKCGK